MNDEPQFGIDETQVQVIRDHIQNGVSQKDILAASAKRTEKFRRRLASVIINEFEIRRIRDSCRFDTAALRSPHEIDSYLATEELFILGFYGPCCVYSRATLEYLLQQDCLAQEEVSDDFQDVIAKIRATQRNPEFTDMLNMLIRNEIWPEEARGFATMVKDNGDFILHHRYDKMARGRTPGEFPIPLPKVKLTVDENDIVTKIEPDGYHERLTYEINREPEERRMSLESISRLQEIIMIRRASLDEASGSARTG